MARCQPKWSVEIDMIFLVIKVSKSPILINRGKINSRNSKKFVLKRLFNLNRLSLHFIALCKAIVRNSCPLINLLHYLHTIHKPETKSSVFLL